MRVLVTGSRDWPYDQSEYIFRILNMYHYSGGITDIIEGGARGVDSIAAAWAKQKRIYKEENHFPADWDNPKYITVTGKSFAGNVRNQQMLDEGRPDIVIAFHNDIENSHGTRDMVLKARKAGVPVEIYPK